MKHLLVLALIAVSILNVANAGPGDLVNTYEANYFNPTKPVSDISPEAWAKTGKIVWHMEAIPGDSENVAVYLSAKTEGNENPEKVIVSKESVYRYSSKSTDGKYVSINSAPSMDCSQLRPEYFSDKGVVQALFQTPYGDVAWVSSTVWTHQDAELFHVNALSPDENWGCN
ncbi:MAG: hypothetical protein V4596_07010 [Bdellovibrionota bacterium]